ncbi:MAG: hypothetical protein PWQ24_1842 [Mesotoga sp.]|nr:hypothetical protein [Mesotoga sp.]
MRNLVKGDYSFIKNSLFECLQAKEPGLVLLSGGNDPERSSLINDVANELNTEVLNLNFVLSKEMKTFSINERPLRASRFLSELVNSRESLLLNHIEILFEPQLKLLPMQILRRASRTTPIVANWPGSIQNEFAIYAQRNHPEFMEVRLDSEIIFKIE